MVKPPKSSHFNRVSIIFTIHFGGKIPLIFGSTSTSLDDPQHPPPPVLIQLLGILLADSPVPGQVPFGVAVSKNVHGKYGRLTGVILEPQTTIYKWMFGETTISYVKIGNHPIETTIYKWLFGVPGLYY